MWLCFEEQRGTASERLQHVTDAECYQASLSGLFDWWCPSHAGFRPCLGSAYCTVFAARAGMGSVLGYPGTNH
jgi:hypothetical protein